MRFGVGSDGYALAFDAIPHRAQSVWVGAFQGYVWNHAASHRVMATAQPPSPTEEFGGIHQGELDKDGDGDGTPLHLISGPEEGNADTGLQPHKCAAKKGDLLLVFNKDNDHGEASWWCGTANHPCQRQAGHLLWRTWSFRYLVQR